MSLKTVFSREFNLECPKYESSIKFSELSAIECASNIYLKISKIKGVCEYILSYKGFHFKTFTELISYVRDNDIATCKEHELTKISEVRELIPGIYSCFDKYFGNKKDGSDEVATARREAVWLSEIPLYNACGLQLDASDITGIENVSQRKPFEELEQMCSGLIATS